jgi:sugar O-acyltransferase (sialic acid O-acetyltransferase NeuD family)
MKKIVIYGANTTAKQVFFESRQNNSGFCIVAFCLGDEFLKGETSFCNLPLIAESEVRQKYPPDEYDMLSCIDIPSNLRTRLIVYERLKEKGYFLRSFISPLAYVSEEAEIGENNIIFAFAQILNDTIIGHSNTIRNTVHIGHDVVMGNGSNIGVGVVIGGYVSIGNSCWVGLNSTINNHLAIANDTLIGSGAVVMRNTKQGTAYVGNPAKPFSSHKDTGIMLKFKPSITANFITKEQM